MYSRGKLVHTRPAEAFDFGAGKPTKCQPTALRMFLCYEALHAGAEGATCEIEDMHMLYVVYYCALPVCRYRRPVLLLAVSWGRLLAMVATFMQLPPGRWAVSVWGRYTLAASRAPLAHTVALSLFDQLLKVCVTCCQVEPVVHWGQKLGVCNRAETQ